MNERLELPQGTLDLLILKIVALEPQHGWAITERLHQISSATLQIRQGSLYPALHRLEAKGWIAASWELSDKGKRARYYRLTALGRRQLVTEQSKWRAFTRAMGLVLNPTGDEP